MILFNILYAYACVCLISKDKREKINLTQCLIDDIMKKKHKKEISIMFGFGKKPEEKAVDSFIAALKSEGIKFSKSDDKASVFIQYDGDNFEDLTFSFFFDEGGEALSIKVFSIMQFTKDQLPDAYKFCNEMNNEWRWIRFYVDSDDEFTADMDAAIHPTSSTCGQEIVNMLHRAVRIVDKVCGELKS